MNDTDLSITKPWSTPTSMHSPIDHECSRKWANT